MIIESHDVTDHHQDWNIQTELWDEPDVFFIQTKAQSGDEIINGAHYLVFKEGGKWLVTKDGAPFNMKSETLADAIMSASLGSSYEMRDVIGGIFLRTVQPMRLKSEFREFDNN